MVQEDVDNAGDELLEDGENDWDKIGVQQGRVAFVWSVDPTEEEVVVAVGQTLDGLEEFNCGSFIEDGSVFRCQGKHCDIEPGISCPLNPLREIVSLDTMFGPIPSILQFSLKTHTSTKSLLETQRH